MSSEVYEPLRALIERAEKENRKIFCKYQKMIFTAEELREANAKGKYRWGAMNFELMEPSDKPTPTVVEEETKEEFVRVEARKFGESVEVEDE